MQSLNIVFTGKRQLELRREEVPALQSGQVLVRAERSLISTGTECICYARMFEPGSHWDNWVKYPFTPGYSNSGRVIDVAPDVTEVKVGDRVANGSSHRQFFVASAKDVLPIPDGVSAEAAPWFALGSIVQNGVRKAEHELGDNVVIIGLGLLGQLAVQYVRASGAREIIGIDTAGPRLEMAKAHGATHVLNMRADEAKPIVAEITTGRLADVVYDITGHPVVFPSALNMVRRFGKMLLLGDAGEPSKQCLTSDVMTRGVRIIGAHDNDAPPDETDYHYWTRRNMRSLFYTYLERGQMRVDDLVTHRFSPEEAEAAYTLLMTDRTNVMGVIFDWERL